MKYVMLFGSIHHVMKAEKVLKGRGFGLDLIPVPREISSDCGVAIEMPLASKEETLRLLQENGIAVFGCYTRRDGKRFEKLG